MLHKEYLHLLVLFGIATCMAQKQFNAYAAVKRKKFKSVYSSVGSLSRIECAVQCSTESRCAAFQYCPGSSICSFSDVGGQFSAYLDDSEDCNVYTKSKPESDQQQGGGGQGEKDWVLAFKGSSGAIASVYDLWNSAETNVTDHSLSLMPSVPKRHYKAAFVELWGTLGIKKVKYAFYENGTEKAFLEFDGSGSTKMNWLSQSRLLGSSWTDVSTTSSPHNYFSVQGWISPFAKVLITGKERHWRRFYVNRKFGLGICLDFGWMFVSEILPGVTSICPAYEPNLPSPGFIYSVKTTVAAFLEPTDYNRADTMAIFIKP